MNDMSDISKQIKKLEEELEKLKKKLQEMGLQRVDRKRVEEPIRIPVVSPEEAVDVEVRSPIENEILRDVRSIFQRSMQEAASRIAPLSKLVDDLDPVEASKTLAALANDIRLLILKLLFYQGRYFSELEEITGLNPSPLNFHLAKLMEAGLVVQERARGRYIITRPGQVIIVLISYLWKRFKEAQLG